MLRPLALVALFACLVWQSLAFAAAPWALQAGGDAGHSAMHLTEEAHHHHHGDVHVDDSDESVAHAMSDHGCCAAALPPSMTPVAEIGPAEALPIGETGSAPTPFVDGWLRPPKA